MPGLTSVLSVVAAVIVFVGGSGGDHGVGDGVGCYEILARLLRSHIM